jgi:hypothetical protein
MLITLTDIPICEDESEPIRLIFGIYNPKVALFKIWVGFPGSEYPGTAVRTAEVYTLLSNGGE